jgi:hypothetical protein
LKVGELVKGARLSIQEIVKHNISTVVRKRRRSDEHVRQADSGRPRTIQGGKKECIKDEMMAIQTEAPKNVCSKF